MRGKTFAVQNAKQKTKTPAQMQALLAALDKILED